MNLAKEETPFPILNLASEVKIMENIGVTIGKFFAGMVIAILVSVAI